MSIFHKRKKHQQHVLMVLAVIGVFIIALIAMMLIKMAEVSAPTEVSEHQNDTSDTTMVETQNTDTDDTDVQTPQTTPQTSDTPEQLRTQYIEKIGELQAYVDRATATVPVMLSHVEETLLAMRVPGDMRDAHLDVVLEIVRLRADTDVMTDEDVLNEVKILLQMLGLK